MKIVVMDLKLEETTTVCPADELDDSLEVKRKSYRREYMRRYRLRRTAERISLSSPSKNSTKDDEEPAAGDCAPIKSTENMQLEVVPMPMLTLPSASLLKPRLSAPKPKDINDVFEDMKEENFDVMNAPDFRQQEIEFLLRNFPEEDRKDLNDQRTSMLLVLSLSWYAKKFGCRLDSSDGSIEAIWNRTFQDFSDEKFPIITKGQLKNMWRVILRRAAENVLTERGDPSFKLSEVDINVLYLHVTSIEAEIERLRLEKDNRKNSRMGKDTKTIQQIQQEMSSRSKSADRVFAFSSDEEDAPLSNFMKGKT